MRSCGVRSSAREIGRRHGPGAGGGGIALSRKRSFSAVSPSGPIRSDPWFRVFSVPLGAACCDSVVAAGSAGSTRCRPWRVVSRIGSSKPAVLVIAAKPETVYSRCLERSCRFSWTNVRLSVSRLASQRSRGSGTSLTRMSLVSAYGSR
jgi:hypothetical protein